MHMNADQMEEAILKAMEKSSSKTLEESFTDATAHNMTILILDELDQLIMSNQSAILYQLLGITTQPRSSLIFIGVANALRLKDSLPLLQTDKFDNLSQITFESYDAAQLLDILRSRLIRVGYPLFDEAALRLCTSQVAKSSGDARQALHFAKLAVEAGLRDLSHTWGAQASRKLPRINARQMLQTMNIALGEPNQRAGLICALPFLQQAMLCSLASAKRCLLTSSTGGTLPWEKAFEAYKAACSREGLGVVTASDFGDMCSALEGHGLLSTVKSKNRLRAGLTLQVSDSEFRLAARKTPRLLRFLPPHLAGQQQQHQQPS